MQEGGKGHRTKTCARYFPFFQKTPASLLEGFLGAQAPRTHWRQACEAAGHTAFTVSTQRAAKAGVQLALSFLFHLRPSPLEMLSQTHSEMCFHGDSKSSQADKTGHHQDWEVDFSSVLEFSEKAIR